MVVPEQTHIESNAARSFCSLAHVLACGHAPCGLESTVVKGFKDSRLHPRVDLLSVLQWIGDELVKALRNGSPQSSPLVNNTLYLKHATWKREQQDDASPRSKLFWCFLCPTKKPRTASQQPDGRPWRALSAGPLPMTASSCSNPEKDVCIATCRATPTSPSVCKCKPLPSIESPCSRITNFGYGNTSLEFVNPHSVASSSS